MTPTEKLTLLGILRFSNEKGECYPGMKKLSDITGLSRNSIKRSIKELSEKGFLQKKNRFKKNEETGSVRKDSNLYIILGRATVGLGWAHGEPRGRATVGHKLDQLNNTNEHPRGA